jgi:hypothetical protein
MAVMPGMSADMWWIFTILTVLQWPLPMRAVPVSLQPAAPWCTRLPHHTDVMPVLLLTLNHIQRGALLVVLAQTAADFLGCGHEP